MATATHCGLSLPVCLVVLERNPARWRQATLPAKPYRRRKGSIGLGRGTHLAHEASAKVRLGPGVTITADWTRDG
jgi:hypothetical protein